MSGSNSGERKLPKLSVESHDESAQAAPEGGASRDHAGGASAHDGLHEAAGFISGIGSEAWRYVTSHPHTAAGAFTGLVVAVLILWLGLWSTIVITVCVAIGAIVGQVRDGDNGIVNFFRRLFGGN